jgi:photosystem II stability/assembly factor-like uncharacterized protein
MIHKLFIFLSFIFLFLNSTFSADGWIWQNPKPQGNTLSDIHAFDHSNAIAVGGAGTVMKTTNGGVDWTIVSNVCGVSSFLTGLYFLDDKTGWIVGSEGILLKTVDGGDYWFRRETGTDYTLHSVHFADALTGWIVGERGTILKTTDGGDSWNTQSDGAYDDYLCVFAVHPDTAWITGMFGKIFKTTNGGENWIRQHHPASQMRLQSAFFIDSKNGWVVGDYATIFQTSDGGTTWHRQFCSGSNNLYHVHFTDKDTGWAVGGNSCAGTYCIIKTTNGGKRWLSHYISPSTSNWFLSVSFANSNIGWIVGRGGTILKSQDGGKSWNSQTQGTTDYLFSISFPDPENGFIVGDGSSFYKTTDGGETWSCQRSLCGTSDILGSSYFFDGQRGWTGGWNGTLLKTTDGGNNWEPRANRLPENIGIVDILFINDDIGFIVGSGLRSCTENPCTQNPKSVILKTVDGGESWAHKYITFSSVLYSAYFLNEQTGWVTGSEGDILKTTDGGETWDLQFSRALNPIHAIYFVNENIGYAVGWIRYHSVILKTKDGGAHWIEQDSGTENYLWSVYFQNAVKGWAVGSGGIILHTIDGGNHWMLQKGVSEDIRDICFLDGTGWIVGSGGTILKTTNDGRKEETIVPEQFTLFQNFPNPFNVSTNFRFFVPELTQSGLYIYDMLGREVDVLSQTQPVIGFQEYRWSPAGLPSGVYIYQLRAGKHIETRKLLLMK